MLFKDKSKPGLMGSLFTKKAPQPTSPASSGTKDIQPEDGPSAAPDTVVGERASNGLFASRRAARRVVEDATDVVEVEPSARPAPAAVAEPDAAPQAHVEDVAAPADAPKAASADSAASRLGDMLKKRNGGAPEPKAAPKAAPPKKEKPAKKEKPVKVAATKPARPPKGAGRASVVFLTELENNRTLYWNVTATALTQLDKPADNEHVLSYSREDTRLIAERPMPYAKALDLAIEEMGEMVGIVNRSKDLHAVYATREERPMTLPYRIAPGQQALDALLHKANRTEQALITGFLLKDASGTSVAILYSVMGDGNSSKPQITVNPDSMEFVLNQFAAGRKINRKETEVVLFGNEDLLSVAGAVQHYPNEKVWNGIPVRVLTNLGAVVSGVAAVGVIGWTGIGYTSQLKVNADLEKMRSEIAAVSAKNNKLIGSSIYSFARSVSLDEAQVFDTAETLWLPHSKVLVLANSEKATYTINVPLTTGAMFHNGPSLRATADNATVQRLYDLTPPTGCTKEKIATSGSFNEIRTNVVCQGSASAFSRFRND